MSSLHQTTRGTGKSISRQNKAARRAVGQQRAPEVVGKPAHAGLGKAHRAIPVVNDPPWREPLRQRMASVPMPRFMQDDEPSATAIAPRIAGFLPATTSVTQPEWREIRRQLAKMCGPRPRYIPSDGVIALGPGSWQSPYQPERLEAARADFLKEMSTAIELWAMRFTAPARMVHHLDWEATNAVQRMQHAAFIYAALMMAV